MNSNGEDIIWNRLQKPEGFLKNFFLLATFTKTFISQPLEQIEIWNKKNIYELQTLALKRELLPVTKHNILSHVLKVTI